ncbi:MAG TPA: carbohydrate binding domain-containing protein [Polyangiaceae bacterium]|jgi:hypothetical protein|nr:carbohydrate binding domain-containing protein [Polyangiaceae bacterium]
MVDSGKPTRSRVSRIAAAFAVAAAAGAVGACSLDVSYLSAGLGDTDAGPDGTGDDTAPDAAADAPDDHVAPAPIADAADARGAITGSEAGAADGADAGTRTSDAAISAADAGPAEADASATDGSPCNAGSPAGNVIENWSFECGVAPWYAWDGGALTMASGIAHTGAASGLTSGRTATDLGPVQDVTAVVAAGRTFATSAWTTVGVLAGGVNPPAQPVDMSLKIFCQGDLLATYVDGGSTSGVLPGKWTLVSGTVALPPDCVLASGTKAELYIEGPEAGIDLYVDDVTLQ